MAFAFLAPRSALIASIVILGIVIGAIALYLYLPSASISVYPATETKEVSQIITLRQGSTPDFVRFMLPARLVEHQREETKAITRQADGSAHEDFVNGEVILKNERLDDQSLVEKTHLRHEASGEFFLTDRSVIIPAQGQITVGVTAKEAGVRGQVPPGKFIVNKLSPALQPKIYGISEAAFSGGVSVEQALTEEELQRALHEAQTSLQQQLKAELTTEAGGARINDDLLVFITEKQQASVSAGSHAQTFTITTNMRARAFVVDENDVLSLTLLALRGAPSEDTEFISYDPQSFRMKAVKLDFERAQAQIEGKLTGTFGAKIGPGIFEADNLAGRTEAEVQEYFEQFPSVGTVEVAFFPFWVRSVPARRDAIEIVIKNQTN